MIGMPINWVLPSMLNWFIFIRLPMVMVELLACWLTWSSCRRRQNWIYAYMTGIWISQPTLPCYANTTSIAIPLIWRVSFRLGRLYNVALSKILPYASFLRLGFYRIHEVPSGICGSIW